MSSSATAANSATTSANRALRTFLEHCCDRPPQPADFASNAVLEWFGRTVRGQQRIQQFFRFDVHRQYEQSFAGARALKEGTDGRVAEAFESKPTHQQTRLTPPENLDATIVITSAAPSAPSAHIDANCHSPTRTRTSQSQSPTDPINSATTPSRADASTPVDRIRYGPPPTPGAPAQGRIFRRFPEAVAAEKPSRKSPANDERTEDEDSDQMSGVDELSGADTNSPPRKAVDQPPPTPRRRKPRAQPISQPRFTHLDDADDSEMLAIEAAARNNQHTISVHYSELQYLEAEGSVRQHNCSKHHRGSDEACAAATAASSAISSPRLPAPTAGCDHWERPVRLRISYRWRTTSLGVESVQFALVVYEHLAGGNPRTRRNLMGDFGRAAEVRREGEVDAELRPQAEPAAIGRRNLMGDFGRDAATREGGVDAELRPEQHAEQAREIERNLMADIERAATESEVNAELRKLQHSELVSQIRRAEPQTPAVEDRHRERPVPATESPKKQSIRASTVKRGAKTAVKRDLTSFLSGPVSSSSSSSTSKFKTSLKRLRF